MKVIMFPGQGAQYKGMGKDLFKVYKNETWKASQLLGFDIEELCVHDPNKQLGLTQFTQPALYTVNAFTYLAKEKGIPPAYLIGHSLGEYNALLAAGAFDFETGLKLVKKRGELMAASSGGGMAVVLGVSPAEVKQKLAAGGYEEIDVANYNTPTQTVISGPGDVIARVIKDFGSQGLNTFPLNVSAPFHSRYMEKAATEFAGFLHDFTFLPLQIPVIANLTARPYEEGHIAQLLSRQIAGGVQWTDTIRLLMGYGVSDFEETGSTFLTKMTTEIRSACTPIIADSVEKVHTPAMRLGSSHFREDYGVDYAYVAGSMYRGIASKELVARMAKANMLSFLGTGGMSLIQIEENIRWLQKELGVEGPYGMNLLHDMDDPKAEMDTVTLYIKNDIRIIEASAFMQITEALAYYRVKGMYKDKDGKIKCKHRIMAKLSHPGVAEAFMSPVPERILKRLMDKEQISAEQAAYAAGFPMADDICVEGDSGGHTDSGVVLVLLPSIRSLYARLKEKYAYPVTIRIGLAGGIGTPEAVACAFIMGADFVMTGSINQCTVAAGNSDVVKDLLQEIDVQDTDYAPAGDMFEIGAKVQVLKKGVLFPARANKLSALYNQYNSLEEIPEKVRQQLERDYFKKSISDVWEDAKRYLAASGRDADITKAENNGKYKMARVFRWYFWNTVRLAFEGDFTKRADFQVQTGPALGAFNQWVKGTSWENWRNRHADEIGRKLMEEAARLLAEKLRALFPENRTLPKTKPKLFMLHFAGGSKFSYQFLVPYLKDFQVHALELPGRGKRNKELLLASFTDAVEDIYQQISPEFEKDRDIIYGHSLGAILGFWVTDKLEKENRAPKCLVVSGNSSPGVKKSELLQRMHQLPEPEFTQVLQEMGGMPEAMLQDKELFRMYEPIIRADLKLLDAVSGLTPNIIHSRVIAMMGTLEKSAHLIQDWRNYTSGSFDFRHLEGDHFFINKHPETIAQLFSKAALS
jgi:trans-AT polyketide synthase/acyltransferase/oxidoreductase domain-containing protein